MRRVIKHVGNVENDAFLRFGLVTIRNRMGYTAGPVYVSIVMNITGIRNKGRRGVGGYIDSGPFARPDFRAAERVWGP